MPISARQVRTGPRSRLVVASVGVVLLVALVVSGRIIADQLLGYVLVIGSLLAGGWVSGLVARTQTAPAERPLIPRTLSRVDPLGTLIVPALLDLGGFGFFGWLRPLPQAAAQRGGRNGLLIRSLSVSATYLALIVGAVVLFNMTYHGESGAALPFVPHVAFFAGFVNLWLLVLSLVPIPPQPGSVLLERLLPVRAWARYARIRPYLLKGVLGALLVSVMLGFSLTTEIQRLIAGWWISICSP